VTTRSLTAKLSLGIVLLVLLSVGLMAGFAVWRSAEALRERALATNHTVALGVSHAVEQYVANAMAIMQEAAERPKLRQEITSGNWPEARTVLENVAHYFRQFDYVFVQDAQGIIRARVPHAETVGGDFSFRDFFREAKRTRRPYLSSVYISKAAQRPAVATAVPVLHDDGRVAGVVVGALSLQAMRRLVSVAAADDGRAIYLVDSQGRVIADSRAAVESLRDVRAEPAVQAVLSGRAGTMVFREPGRGEEMLGAYVPIRSFGWGVVVIRPTAAAQAPAARLTTVLLWIALGCTVGAIGLGVGLARRLTHPLLRLAEASKRIAAGELSTRVAVSGPEEVATLAGAFNQMADAVAQSHQAAAQHAADVEAVNQKLLEEVAERRQAEAAARHQAERLAILHEIDRAILALHSPARIAETTLRQLRRLVRAPRAALALYDLAAGEATWLAVDVGGHTELPPGGRFPLEMMGDLDALRRGEMQIVEVRSLSHLPAGRAVAAEGVRSYAVVPLLAEGDLIGSLNLGATESGGPSTQDLVVAREIAAQLAIALQQGRLYQEAKESRDRFEAVLASSPLAIVTTDLTGLVTTWNPAATTLFEWTPEEVLGRPLPTIPAAGQAEYEAFLAGYQRGEAVTDIETTRRRKDGSLVDVVLSVAPILDAHGRPLGAMGVMADITQRKQLEQQLRQAQKMDAIGQLAGGVAHDFNNLLTVIGGRSSLLLDKMGPDDPARRHVELIERTGQRAAGLTRQLLAFSRKQVLELKPLDLNILVAGVTPMLRRLIGEHIEVVVVPGRDVGHVMADAGQMEQVVMNLVVNARDAMSEGGMVKIETAYHAVREPRLHSQGQVPPGQYVTLTVQDTGSGIDSVTLARIFEPFFTTKEPGKGTGLGLSTVHGIVHQSGGYIAVDSALGRGTTFTLYLPRITGPIAIANAPKESPKDLMQGTETILLVEDDDEVRRLGCEILQTCGYTVVETGNPLEALTIGERRNGAIDLLLTDMVMPGMDGLELAKHLEAARPELRVLCMSGYADKIAVVAAHQPPRTFLLKPFTPLDLATKVREALT
jgi:PAS domain S-box-containing protein